MKEIINFQNPNEHKNKKINKKKLTILISIIIVILAIIITSIVYVYNKPFRKFLDRYLFRKNITEEKLISIQLDYDSNVNVIAYNKYICVLAENTLKQYHTSGELVNEIKLEVSNPVYYANDKYLAISEKGSSKIYIILDTKIAWQKELDGNVSKIDINKDGYVAVTLTGTTHKSVIVTYDDKGNELFKTYLASTNALDATVSPDDKYLAFAEINTSGTIIQSTIKIISIEKAKDKEADYIIYKYDAPANSLITNIEYQSKDKLLCFYDDSIHMISNNQDETILDLQEKNLKINAADIKLKGAIYRAIEKQSGLFKADTVVEITNTDNRKKVEYTVEGVAKSVYAYGNIIAINLGQEIEFINTSGWLVKNYTSSQDIQGLVLGNGVAGIVYHDRVELTNL